MFGLSIIYCSYPKWGWIASSSCSELIAVSLCKESVAQCQNYHDRCVLYQEESPLHKGHCHWIREDDVLASEVMQHSRENTRNLCLHSKFVISQLCDIEKVIQTSRSQFVYLWCEGIEWDDPVSPSSLWLRVILVALVGHRKVGPMVPNHRFGKT